MKKFLLLGLTLLLLTALFVGCTGGEDPVTTDDPSATTGEDATAAPTEPDGDATETPTEESTEESTEAPTEEVTTDYFEANRIETVKPDENKVIDMAVTDKGYDIYRLPEDQSWGYRYGVTYLYGEDNTVHAYFACVGTISGEWDWISYRRSDDGGATWSEEKIVLTPTQGSMDHFSNCDPGVVYFNGYYYLGYTSTLNETGACNNVFVARSVNPDGPFEKWNGSGWGGYEPQPLFYYDEAYGKFGMGEPSFVELNGTLYIYYTNAAPSGEYTMVATADATDENWPATLQHRGTAVKKNTDSIDVKYVEEWGKFIGIATGSRMGPSSYVAVYESNDGLTFELVDAVRENTFSHLHNAGISSRVNGHIKLADDADKLRVIYAYGEGWGTWNTRVQPITLALSDGNDMNAERAKPCIKEFVRGTAVPKDQRELSMIRPEQDVYFTYASRGSFTLRINVYDTYFDKSTLKKGTEGVSFKVHDESVCTVSDDTWKVEIKGVGTTAVELWYGDLVCLFHVVVTEEKQDGSATQALELVPVHDTYTIYLGERSLYKPQLRAQMKWGDGSFTEYFVTDSDAQITFTGYDQSIITVSDKGIVTALKTGETEVTLTYMKKTCKIKVIVTGDPEQGFYRLPDTFEVDYTDLDFSVKGTLSAVTGLNGASVSYDETEAALKAVVTGGDAQFWLSMSQSIPALKAEDYKTLEITYKCPKDTSSKATMLQWFFMVGSVTDPTEQCGLKKGLTKDGEYHTMTVDLTSLSYWDGTVNALRLDFFDQSEVGDTMYIKSIKLIKK
ncbi:MAG: hypothetical protein IJ363_12215 [Clostridia bacterium]|nr:hypothetical protein [Clostridia bacterium]